MNKGHILGDRYEIVDILGTGGMGCVYLARNIKLDTLWAIKELRKIPEREKFILTEVDVLKNLDHQALPKVFDIIETDESFFVVYTYINGMNLSTKLMEVGKFDEKTVVNWAICLCDVLYYLHNLKPNPIIYRDLKPSNIMLCDDGNIKLIDFGIAREYKEENMQDTVFIGTRGYAAPEQCNGIAQSGPYTDIYSLGITMHQLLTGRNPLASPQENLLPVTELNPFISKELEKIIIKCTYKEFEKRFESAFELKEKLLSISQKWDDNEKGIKNRRVETITITEKKAFYKQLVIGLDNSEFATEIAISAAMSGINVLLVDFGLFTPNCDFYLGVQKQFREFRVMNELDNNELDNLSIFNSDPGKYIFNLNSNKNLSYLTLDALTINDEDIICFLNYVKDRYDFVIVNSSINIINNAKKLFQSADKIIIADRLDCDSIDFWRRSFYKIFNTNELLINKVFYIGWLFDTSEGIEAKAVRELLGDIEYVGEISNTSKRRKNRNFCIGSAFANVKDTNKEYNKILFNLNISPSGYIDDTSSGLFRFLRRK